mgnify:CR=1 FL=1
MTQIRINTDHVREAGQQLAAQSGRVAEIGEVVQRAVSSLDTAAWDGVSRTRAEPMLGRAGPEALRLSEALGALGQKLAHVASAFEERDTNAAHQLTGLPWVAWSAGTLRGSTAGGNPDDEGPENPDFSRTAGGEGATYTAIPGTPFVRGRGDVADVEPNDVHQGNLGDCFLLASMAAIARQNPEAIRRMIRDNGDGTYTVTLYRNSRPLRFWQPEYTPVEVEVTQEFPAVDGEPVFAQPGDGGGAQQELWTLLVEKAYAQQQGGYGDLEGGWGHTAMSAMTGVESEWHAPSSISLGDLAGHFDQGHAITVSSLADLRVEVGGEAVWDIPDASDVHPLFQSDVLFEHHEYYVTGVSPETGTVSIRNPWGWHQPEIDLSFEDFQSAFRRVSINPITP